MLVKCIILPIGRALQQSRARKSNLLIFFNEKRFPASWNEYRPKNFRLHIRSAMRRNRGTFSMGVMNINIIVRMIIASYTDTLANRSFTQLTYPFSEITKSTFAVRLNTAEKSEHDLKTNELKLRIRDWFPRKLNTVSERGSSGH